MFETIVSAALIANEHWVCAVSHSLEPSRTVIFDFEVIGNELVQMAPAEVRYRILRNDDRKIVGVWLPSCLPRQGVNVTVIDKKSSRFRLSQVYVGRDDISVEGNCTRG